MSDRPSLVLSLDAEFKYIKMVCALDQASLEDAREVAKLSYRMFLAQQDLVADWAKEGLPIVPDLTQLG